MEKNFDRKRTSPSKVQQCKAYKAGGAGNVPEMCLVRKWSGPDMVLPDFVSFDEEDIHIESDHDAHDSYDTLVNSTSVGTKGQFLKLNDGDVIAIALPSGDPDTTRPMYCQDSGSRCPEACRQGRCSG